MRKIKDLVYDYYNLRWRKDGIAGTITTGTAHNGSGTFLVIEYDEQRNNKSRKL